VKGSGKVDLANMRHELGKITNKKFQLARRNPGHSIPFRTSVVYLNIIV
jgi:hypothetical protein